MAISLLLTLASCLAFAPSSAESGSVDSAVVLAPAASNAATIKLELGAQRIKIVGVGDAPVGLRLSSWGRPNRLLDASTGAHWRCTVSPAADRCERAEQRLGTLVHWWTVKANELEQGFDVLRRPLGRGPLVVEMRVDGARVETTAGASVFVTESGERLDYDGLEAWDSRGLPLELHFEARDGGVAIVVDDSRAQYPVTIDPMLGPAAWDIPAVQLEAGDIDGDGFSDFVGVSSGASVEVTVVLGGADGPTSQPLQSFTIDEAGSGAATAWRAGDVDGDGFADVLVTTPELTATAESEGAAFLFRGSAAGLLTDPAWSYYGGESPKLGVGSGGFGTGVAANLDLDDDGFDDLVLLAPGYGQLGSTDNGRIFVFRGGPTGPSLSPDLEFSGPEQFSIASIAGVHREMHDDLVLALVPDTLQAVLLQIWEGDDLLVADAFTASVDTAGASDPKFGGGGLKEAVPGVVSGDFNGDGRADLATAVDGALPIAVAYYGTDDGFARAPDWSFMDPSIELEKNMTATTTFASVLVAGDLDGDGADELVIANPGRDVRTYVIPGGIGGLLGWPSDIILAPDDVAGWAFAARPRVVSDADGDGRQELLLDYYEVDDESGIVNGRLYPAIDPTWCDEDTDHDGVCDDVDSCPDAFNPRQTRGDDQPGGICSPPSEGDGGTSFGGLDSGSGAGDAAADSSDGAAETTGVESAGGATTDSGSSAGSADGGQDSPRADTGCGCSSTPDDPAWSVWFAMFGIAATRRRAARG